jgi:hypothetical protein
MNPFKKAPIATLVAWAAVVLTVLVALQASGLLTGTAARWVDFAAGALQIVLTAYARQHVTPVADPKDDLGRPLVPEHLVPGRGISKPPPNSF